MVATGKKLSDFAQHGAVRCTHSRKSLNRGELIEAAFYYRAEEFYTIPPNRKRQASDRNSSRTYSTKHSQPMASRSTRFPMRILCLRNKVAWHNRQVKQGTIVIHGGFDSYIEEFYSMMCHFSNEGYEVIGFDGPGQGATRRRYGIAFDYRWEKPTKWSWTTFI